MRVNAEVKQIALAVVERTAAVDKAARDTGVAKWSPQIEVFVIEAAAQKGRQAGTRIEFHTPGEQLMNRTRGSIYRSPKVRLHDVPAVGIRKIALQHSPNWTAVEVYRNRVLRSVADPIGGLSIDPVGLRGALADYVDHATLGLIAPQVGTTTLHHFNPVDALQRDLVPVEPASERVVDRDTVEHNHRPARSARTDSPQRHTFSLGVVGRRGYDTAGAAEGIESSDLTQQ